MKTVQVYCNNVIHPLIFKDVIKVQVLCYNGFSETLVIYQDKTETHFLRHHVERYTVIED